MKKIISVLLLASVLLLLCACGEANDVGSVDASSTAQVSVEESKAVSEESVESNVEEPSFKVTVVDQGGNPVAGVMLQICKDSCIPAKTDENGVATFKIEVTADHKLSVLSCPAGYEYNGEAEVYLSDDVSEYTVEVAKLAKEG